MTKILVIDDNQMVSKLLQEALTEEGFQVAVAFDANDGYTTAIDFLPDLILLDVSCRTSRVRPLPVIKNHKELGNVPIIMITGTHDRPRKGQGFQMGIDDYVLKPFEMAELVERIKAVLRRTQATRPASPSKDLQARSLSFRPLRCLRPANLPDRRLRPCPQFRAVLPFQCAVSSVPRAGSTDLPRIAIFFLVTILGLVFGGLLRRQALRRVQPWLCC